VGFFQNPKVALVQTPHWFYNPDPFERNLLTKGKIPVAMSYFIKCCKREMIIGMPLFSVDRRR
jgi:cellulose synthase (UDP-forming)